MPYTDRINNEKMFFFSDHQKIAQTDAEGDLRHKKQICTAQRAASSQVSRRAELGEEPVGGSSVRGKAAPSCRLLNCPQPSSLPRVTHSTEEPPGESRAARPELLLALLPSMWASE